ncbi:hypothetical protein [Streptomyces sp. W1SF4]|uniref:hypothetical protein n=1 Tax=Streptomyces sp. W1SF4 TaxID=2305220 RepID=UPI000F711965|nr:hypothetical protein [Streptomyces sp. W1SF4]AZM91714.1 hypothetical protein D1J60_27180 [Streptomyces sp. W1SF4]
MAQPTATRTADPAPAAAPAPARPGPPHTPAPGAAAVTGGLLVVALLLCAGPLAGGAVQEFLDRMAGVFALVALSGSVMLGLTTVFRDVLTPAQRQFAQLLHRAAGLAGVGFLLVHIGVKVAGRKIGAADAVLGWGSGDLLVDLGTLAAQLFVLALLTGLWRGVFATRRWIRPFRLLHGAAYAGWAAGLVHGLGAGRTPAGWVVACYVLCAAATLAALAYRLTRGRGRGPRPR